MRIKKRFHQLPTGEWSPWPQTREEAVKQNIRFYQPIPYKDHCKRPNHGGEYDSVVFTKTGISRCCAMEDGFLAFNEAVTNGEPTDPTDATIEGYDYYWESEYDHNCGHNGKKTISGKCYYCETEKINKEISPRQKAIIAGEEWYMPAINDPCKNGHVALRRITNGECKECSKRVEREPPIYDLYPDMIIDRETAKTLGFTAYRTGKPCRQGHTGWRYLANNCCIQCQKG